MICWWMLYQLWLCLWYIWGCCSYGWGKGYGYGSYRLGSGCHGSCWEAHYVIQLYIFLVVELMMVVIAVVFSSVVVVKMVLKVVFGQSASS